MAKDVKLCNNVLYFLSGLLYFKVSCAKSHLLGYPTDRVSRFLPHPVSPFPTTFKQSVSTFFITLGGKIRLNTFGWTLCTQWPRRL